MCVLSGPLHFMTIFPYSGFPVILRNVQIVEYKKKKLITRTQSKEEKEMTQKYYHNIVDVIFLLIYSLFK